MNPISEENIRILRRRWPSLAETIIRAPLPETFHWAEGWDHPVLDVDGQRLWSVGDAEAEAVFQANRVPADAVEAWVYGIGSGDLPRELLARLNMRRLRVVVLNPAIAHLLIRGLDLRSWLDDPRVELLDGAREREPHHPFAVVPPCLALCDEAAIPLRDRLVLELNTPFERERRQREEPRRQRLIARNLPLIEADGDVAELFGSHPGGDASVAIAGPTLNDTLPRLRDRRGKGPLIAVDAALRPLLEGGVTPDVVVTVDDNGQWVPRYFAGDLAACADATLVYVPVTDPGLLARWPGRRLTTYTFESSYDRLRRSHPKGELFIAGSVAHLAVDLAVRMGSASVALFGADFGFPGGRIHANPAAPVAWYADAAHAGGRAPNGRGELIATLPSFTGYRLDLERYIARHPRVTFISASREGAAIDGAGYLDGVAP